MCSCPFLLCSWSFLAYARTSPPHKDVRELVCKFCVFLLYVRPSCGEGAFRACPCTSPPHKDVRTLVCEFVSSCCTFGRLVTREHFGLAHAPLLFIKTNGHLCLCSRPLPCAFIFRAHLCLYPLVHSAHAVILKPWLVTINENTGPTKRGNEPLLEK